MFTIDASVHLNALNPKEAGSLESQALLERIHQNMMLIYSPTLLLVELAAGIARVFNDASQGVAMAQAVRWLPGYVWVPLDDALAEEAVQLGAKLRLRGADAVYAAVAHHYQATLITLDQQQLGRLSSDVKVQKPGEILAGL